VFSGTADSAYMERQDQIKKWLADLWPGDEFSFAAASNDASFRRYFRARKGDGSSFVIMDAPPASEDCRPWLHVQRLFHGAGVHVPDVLAQDLERGFLLLSDLGNTTYLQAFDAGKCIALVCRRNCGPGADSTCQQTGCPAGV
jgi:aminoglycoside/choline kinase family phosphotransferase